MEKLKDVVVIHHGPCRDGFGAAYAAWKKFGENATYIPMKTQTDLTVELTDKELYILDISFDRKTLQRLIDTNKSVLVIDHHKSAEEDVTSFPNNIFDNNHSGAVLSWKYFHPSTPVPTLLEYIEDHDIWKFELPNNREFGAAIGEYEVSFKSWDRLIENLKKEEFLSNFINTGAILSRFEDKLVDDLIQFKERVLFEGHEVWALNVSRRYRSILGHNLATLNGKSGGTELGIVYYHNNGAVNVSLRSNGDVDVSEIAQKYGGGGHKNAASIRADSFENLPFTFID
jgi:oligoribonuclease NrnB/cAMP/cGMP phosphodiesterase (DHH superfamily)